MRKPSSKEAKPKAETAKATKYASFSSELVHRSKLLGAPYNPRKITDEARKRLKKNIERVGLLEPLIWNKRTGHIVGGHQRLRALDSLEETSNYLVPVAVVDLSEIEEKAQNIFLNNGEAQGDWDLDVLKDLVTQIPDIEMTGFDNADMFQIFGFNKTFDPEREEDIDKLNPERDQEWERRSEQAGQRENEGFYLVVVFGDESERADFLKEFKLPDNRYLDARRLREVIRGGG